MAVIRTDKWLGALNMSNIIEELGVLLEQYFPDMPLEAIYFELVRNGLFKEDESAMLQGLLMKPSIWTLLEHEYARLRTLWNGPDVPILIFPITEGNSGKNGITYEGSIILFVAAQLTDVELKALLVHEYHHACRMHYLKKAPNEMTLLDSVILEGLAEYAVEDLYGTELLSPWTQRYDWDEIKPIWYTYFEPVLYQVDVRKHRIYLYGDEKGLPPWIGYCAGYRIVENFLQSHTVDQLQLLHLPATLILNDANLS